jgi:hypothetical protein
LLGIGVSTEPTCGGGSEAATGSLTGTGTLSVCCR